jgi:hypothetical protein
MKNGVISFTTGTGVKCYERGNEPSLYIIGHESADQLGTNSVSEMLDLWS